MGLPAVVLFLKLERTPRFPLTQGLNALRFASALRNSPSIFSFTDKEGKQAAFQKKILEIQGFAGKPEATDARRKRSDS